MQPFTETFYADETFKGIVADSEQIREVTFQNCSFIQCSFRETAFRACRFQSCKFKKCDLSLASVDHSAFTNTVFEASKLIGVNWVRAAWGKTGLYPLLKSIDFIGCVLNYSSFMGLALEKITLRKCVAREVDFSETNLKQADCRFTDFENSQFRHTNLSEADFRGASNYSIQAQLNTIKQARFSLPEAMSLLYNLEIEIQEAADNDQAADAQEQ